MNPEHLIELAEQILQIGAGYPRQATINRAVSTAYYALFHALAGECVARTVGTPRSPRYWDIVTPVHRAIDHGTARKVLERLARDRSTSNDLKTLAEVFIELQSAGIRPTMTRPAGIRVAKLATSSFRPAARSTRSAPSRKRIA